jgi:hypothetical protein
VLIPADPPCHTPTAPPKKLCHPSKGALACEAKFNLHPLAFFTIEVTSPRVHVGEGHFGRTTVNNSYHRRREETSAPAQDLPSPSIRGGN